MNKKILALVLAFVLVFSTVTVAFAEEIISADVKALAAIGMLKGDGNGVTADYVKSTPTRLQAAILFLRLKGLEEEAKINNGTDNFKDVLNYEWAEGKNIMSYLKAHPELGWIGNEIGNFMPGDKINEQSYYKVLLEALGYKQNTGTVVGDFEYAEVFEFAKSIGLAPENLESFTIDNLASATVDALKNKMKDGKLLVEVLMENGKINKQIAIDNGLYEEVIAKVESAKAIGNAVVEVTFEEVSGAFAEKAANYSIAGLTIKSAVLVAENVVRLETTAMTAGKLYTLTVGEVKVNFAGLAKVTGTPALTKAEGTDTERVVLTFDKTLDFASATNVANYEIANVKVVKAEVSENKVTLTTEGLVANKNYTIKVANVKSVDGVAMKATSKTFLAKSDKVAPKLSSVAPMTNTRIEVTFSENVTKASATNIDNYTIIAGTNALAIESIEMVEKNKVEITTASQKAGTKYDITINNIVDRSVLANAMTKEAKSYFYGKAADKSAPTFVGMSYLSKTLVAVTFGDASRLDAASALDVNNYTFNNDIAVEGAKFEDAEDADCKVILLTVSEMTINKAYKLSIANVKDEYGNEMDEVASNSKTVLLSASVLDAAKVVSVKAINKTVEITFSKKLNTEAAENIANYSINNNIGNPVAAEYKDNKVTLTTGAAMTAGKTYKVTIDGLTDLAGNALKSTNSFVASATSIDTEEPEVASVEALNNRVIAVTFSESMKKAGSITVNGKTLNYVDSSEDATVLYFTNKADIFAAGDAEDTAYPVTFTGIFDASGNALVIPEEAYLKEVYANKDEVEDIILESVNQTQVNEFRLIFSGKLQNAAITMVPAAGEYSATTITAELDEDDASVIIVKGAFKAGKVYKVQIGTTLKGIFGEKVLGENETAFISLYAELEDEDAPYIEKVEATNRRTVVVTYNEDLKSASYSYDLKLDDKAFETGKIGSVDGKKVTLTLSKDLEAGKIYTLIAKSKVEDIAGNKAELDEEYYFEGTNLVPADAYVTVSVINKNIIKVVLSKGDMTEVVVKDGDVVVATVEAGEDETLAEEINLGEVTLVKGVTYTVIVNDNASLTATFEGMYEAD